MAVTGVNFVDLRDWWGVERYEDLLSVSGCPHPPCLEEGCKLKLTYPVGPYRTYAVVHNGEVYPVEFARQWTNEGYREALVRTIKEAIITSHVASLRTDYGYTPAPVDGTVGIQPDCRCGLGIGVQEPDEL